MTFPADQGQPQPVQPGAPGQPPQPGAFGYPQQANQPPAATGQLVLELRKPWGSMGMITPSAQIDGQPARVQWGTNQFVVPAGTRQIFASCTYLWTYGKATEMVPVGPGQQVVVHYSPPMFTLMKGRLGPNRMPYGGTVAMIVLLAFLVLVIVLIVLAATLS